jgi:AcrR family transcriptional regulator
LSVETLPAGASATERRRRIVDAALHLFSETDYGAVQMDDVARTAVVAKPTLYRYFPTKEALFLEVIEQLLAELEADVASVAAQDCPAPDSLRGAIRRVFLALSRCTAVIHAFDGADGQLGEKGRTAVRRRVRSIRTVVERILSRGVEAGQFRAIEVDLTATAILGACRMSAALAPAGRRSAALETLLDFTCRGVLAAASAEPCLASPKDLTEDRNR